MGITLHIKNMGENTWTDRLRLAAQEKGSDLRVRLEGPYGHMSVKLEEYPDLVLIAGGVGFTPMAPLLEMALDSERRTNLLPHLRRIWLVWTVQSYDQLMWFEVTGGEEVTERKAEGWTAGTSPAMLLRLYGHERLQRLFYEGPAVCHQGQQTGEEYGLVIDAL